MKFTIFLLLLFSTHHVLAMGYLCQQSDIDEKTKSDLVAKITINNKNIYLAKSIHVEMHDNNSSIEKTKLMNVHGVRQNTFRNESQLIAVKVSMPDTERSMLGQFTSKDLDYDKQWLYCEKIINEISSEKCKTNALAAARSIVLDSNESFNVHYKYYHHEKIGIVFHPNKDRPWGEQIDVVLDTTSEDCKVMSVTRNGDGS